MVFILFGLAFKLPRATHWKAFLNGLMGNMQENEFSGLDNRFCPVLFSMPGGFLVVMKEAKALTISQWELFDYQGFVNGKECVAPVEEKISSFGNLNGQIVAVDYGS